MRMLGLAALILVGCIPAQAVIDDVVDTDTGTDDTGDDDTGDDTDLDTDDDTGNPDTGDDPTPDLSEWHGQRVFSFEDVYGQGPCQETILEEGVNVTADSDYAGALEACADCEEIFWIEAVVSRGNGQEPDDHMCRDQTSGQGFEIASPILRGIEFIGNDVKVYVFREGWGGWTAEELAEGTLDSTDVAYEYFGNAYGADYHVYGTIEF